jgi:methyl-accepting chemotaxis protein
MNSSNNINAGQKALSTKLAGLIAVIVVIALAGLFLQKLISAGNAFDDYQRSVKLSNDINAVHANLYKIKNMVATSQSKQEIARVSDQQTASLNKSISVVRQTLDGSIGAEQKKYYKAIADNLAEYKKSAAQVMRLAPMGSDTAYLTIASEKIDVINQLFNQLLNFEGNLASKESGPSILSYIVALLLIAMLVVSIIVVPSFIKKMMDSNVVEPLQETSGVLREYAAGKYGRSLSWDADDAIGELIHAVNALRTKISSAPAPRAAAEPVQSPKAPERSAPVADGKTKTLSDMIKKTPESKDVDQLVTSSKKAIDKLQEI